MFKVDKRLQGKYDFFNKAFFNGELPDAQVGYSDEIGNQLWGLTVGVETEEAEHLSFTIFIDKKLKDPDLIKYRCMVLLHEMTHVRRFPSMKHDRGFYAEMLRLASLGAFDGLW